LIDDERVRREQEDLALALALATLAGLVAAVTLAGLAARALARPVAELRDAALAVGRGAVPDFQRGAPQEFQSVFAAFERMAADVRESREALDAARRRTAQVLANVATGVIALDGELQVTIANPRAEELLGSRLEPGRAVSATAPPAWEPVWSAVAEFMRRPAHPSAPEIAEREFDIGGRQIRVQIAALGARRDGCVVALDDATALTRAARVLAWGEMARQVAHEIKNPLTPIRLGVQHLQRARRGADFENTLQDTARRILGEIDRLDTIARAFARFGTPGGGVGLESPPLEPVDAFRTAREVVQLYALGGDGEEAADSRPRFEVAGEPGVPVLARPSEVKEVLINLLENARQADAKHVVVRIAEGGTSIAVSDDGRGIPASLLPRVFEPTFSTTSSGAGLGLPIARRLVESWGGTIQVTSQEGGGTSVLITLAAVPAGEGIEKGEAGR
jgi:nitrogen fixation/metabolism regulation signal transduction histidine kinase